jgi:hypothetical protein
VEALLLVGSFDLDGICIKLFGGFTSVCIYTSSKLPHHEQYLPSLSVLSPQVGQNIVGRSGIGGIPFDDKLVSC